MAIVSVYDLDGVEHKRESVDARELVAIGWTREPKAVKPTERISYPEVQPDNVEVFGNYYKAPETAAQLREALSSAGIDYRTNASKAELQSLFDNLKQGK